MRSTQHRTVEPGVLEPAQWGPAAPSLWSRLLDGAHPWGSFDTVAGRYGVRRYRLIIYPAGISTAERRLARLWRGWLVSGGVLGLLAVLLLGNVVSSPIAVLVVALVTYVSVGALLFVVAGPTRVHVRTMSVVLMRETADAHELRRYTEWQALVQTLTRADHMLAIGAMSSGDYEATWREAYDRLEGTARV